MRSKEEANDYRYFPCPDLLPVDIDDEFIESVRKNLPELPDARKLRFIEEYQLSDYDANALAADANTAHYFETATKNCHDAKLVANWVMGDLSAQLNNADIRITDAPVSAENLAGLITRVKDNTISNKIAKQVFEDMWQGQGDADSIIESKGLKQMSDSGELEKIVDDVIANNQAMVDDWVNSDEAKRKKKMGGFMGPIMKATKGQANPGLVNKILSQKLNSLLP
jgi:aspartyl-tRNA(Asn)/glutamyl-tRNA(Gln) amidotransferase subunit B